MRYRFIERPLPLSLSSGEPNFPEGKYSYSSNAAISCASTTNSSIVSASTMRPFKYGQTATMTDASESCSKFRRRYNGTTKGAKNLQKAQPILYIKRLHKQANKIKTDKLPSPQANPGRDW